MTEAITLGRDAPDAVTIKRNAKGEYAWDIKVYFNATEESADDVVNNLRYIDGKMRGAFLVE